MADRNEAAERALTLETKFLRGVRANLEQARGSRLKGSIWNTHELDQGDALRAMMASRLARAMMARTSLGALLQMVV